MFSPITLIDDAFFRPQDVKFAGVLKKEVVTPTSFYASLIPSDVCIHSLCNCLSCFLQPLSTAHGGLSYGLSGGSRRVRHELQGAPYEAVETPFANEVYYPELVRLAALERAMSSPGGQLQDEHFAQALERAMASSGNQLQDDRLAQALERAVVPPSNPLQPDERLALALQQLLKDGHRRDQESVYLANLLRLWDEAKGATLYPEYDETGLMGGSSRPRLLLNRYWVPEGGFEPQEDLGGEEEPAGEVDSEMLR